MYFQFVRDERDQRRSVGEQRGADRGRARGSPAGRRREPPEHRAQPDQLGGELEGRHRGLGERLQELPALVGRARHVPRDRALGGGRQVAADQQRVQPRGEPAGDGRGLGAADVFSIEGEPVGHQRPQRGPDAERHGVRAPDGVVEAREVPVVERAHDLVEPPEVPRDGLCC